MPLFKKRPPPPPTITTKVEPAVAICIPDSDSVKADSEQRKIRRHTLVKSKQQVVRVTNRNGSENGNGNAPEFTNDSDVTITDTFESAHRPPHGPQHPEQPPNPNVENDHLVGLAYPNRPYTWAERGHGRHGQSASAASSIEGGGGGTGTETTDSLFSVSGSEALGNDNDSSVEGPHWVYSNSSSNSHAQRSPPTSESAHVPVLHSRLVPVVAGGERRGGGERGEKGAKADDDDNDGYIVLDQRELAGDEKLGGGLGGKGAEAGHARVSRSRFSFGLGGLKFGSKEKAKDKKSRSSLSAMPSSNPAPTPSSTAKLAPNQPSTLKPSSTNMTTETPRRTLRHKYSSSSPDVSTLPVEGKLDLGSGVLPEQAGVPLAPTLLPAPPVPPVPTHAHVPSVPPVPIQAPPIPPVASPKAKTIPKSLFKSKLKAKPEPGTKTDVKLKSASASASATSYSTSILLNSSSTPAPRSVLPVPALPSSASAFSSSPHPTDNGIALLPSSPPTPPPPDTHPPLPPLPLLPTTTKTRTVHGTSPSPNSSQSEHEHEHEHASASAPQNHSTQNQNQHPFAYSPFSTLPLASHSSSSSRPQNQRRVSFSGASYHPPSAAGASASANPPSSSGLNSNQNQNQNQYKRSSMYPNTYPSSSSWSPRSSLTNLQYRPTAPSPLATSVPIYDYNTWFALEQQQRQGAYENENDRRRERGSTVSLPATGTSSSSYGYGGSGIGSKSRSERRHTHNPTKNSRASMATTTRERDTDMDMDRDRAGEKDGVGVGDVGASSGVEVEVETGLSVEEGEKLLEEEVVGNEERAEERANSGEGGDFTAVVGAVGADADAETGIERGEESKIGPGTALKGGEAVDSSDNMPRTEEDTTNEIPFSASGLLSPNMHVYTTSTSTTQPLRIRKRSFTSHASHASVASVVSVASSIASVDSDSSSVRSYYSCYSYSSAGDVDEDEGKRYSGLRNLDMDDGAGGIHGVGASTNVGGGGIGVGRERIGMERLGLPGGWDVEPFTFSGADVDVPDRDWGEGRGVVGIDKREGEGAREGVAAVETFALEGYITEPLMLGDGGDGALKRRVAKEPCVVHGGAGVDGTSDAEHVKQDEQRDEEIKEKDKEAKGRGRRPTRKLKKRRRREDGSAERSQSAKGSAARSRSRISLLGGPVSENAGVSVLAQIGAFFSSSSRQTQAPAATSESSLLLSEPFVPPIPVSTSPHRPPLSRPPLSPSAHSHSSRHARSNSLNTHARSNSFVYASYSTTPSRHNSHSRRSRGSTHSLFSASPSFSASTSRTSFLFPSLPSLPSPSLNFSRLFRADDDDDDEEYRTIAENTDGEATPNVLLNTYFTSRLLPPALGPSRPVVQFRI